MANTEWLAAFPSSQTEFLPFEGSDHRPLVTCLSKEIENRRGQFYYDKRLFQRDGFREMVVANWTHSNSPSISLSSKLRDCRKSMAAWMRKNRSHAAEQISLLKCKLDQALSYGNSSTQHINDIRQKLNKAYIQRKNSSGGLKVGSLGSIMEIEILNSSMLLQSHD